MDNKILFFRPQVVDDNAFVSVWDTAKSGSVNTRIVLPSISGGQYNCSVNWGDGITTTHTTLSSLFHDYAVSGVYEIRVTGLFKGFAFNGSGDCLKILEVKQWGILQLTSGGFFQGCKNVNMANVTDVLNTSNMTNLVNAFIDCWSLTNINRINEWNVGHFTAFNGSFYQCYLFNSDLSTWNVANSTTFNFMLYACHKFNQNIGNWNVSKNTGNLGNFIYQSPIAFSKSNCDSLLIGWASRPVVANQNLNLGAIKRTTASDSAKLILTSAPNNWTVTDGGY